jgi:hypothetical protein
VNLNTAISILALASLACANNATISESQCAAGDWQTIGYRDGAIGYRSTRLLAHQDACVQHGVVPNRDDYQLGWQQGIQEFCDPNNAFLVGTSGQRHNNVCPTGQRDDFLSAYREGRKLYLTRAEVANLERQIRKKRLRLQFVKEKMVSTATAQLNPLLTPAARIELLAKIERLNGEKNRLAAQIPQLEDELARKADELEELNQLMAALTF